MQDLKVYTIPMRTYKPVNPGIVMELLFRVRTALLDS